MVGEGEGEDGRALWAGPAPQGHVECSGSWLQVNGMFPCQASS